MSGLFAFFPVKPVKKYNHVLVPNSTLLPRSALVPVDPVTRKRKFYGSTNRNPAHGPVNAYAMSSDPGGISIGAVGGYGNSNYGALAYGESISIKFRKNENAIFEELEKRMPEFMYS